MTVDATYLQVDYENYAMHPSFVDAAVNDTNDTSYFAVRTDLERAKKYDAASMQVLAVEIDDYHTSFQGRNYVRYPMHLRHRYAHTVVN